MSEMIPASRGVANAGLATGITGATLGAINTLAGLGSATVARNAVHDSDEHFVNRYEMNLVRELQNKDAALAIAESEKYTDKKMVEVYNALNAQDKAIRADVAANYREFRDFTDQQSTYNGVNTATLSCMQNQINQLLSLTKLVIPNGSCCPGWGQVEVKPATTTTTPATGA
nr:MAG TPA: hypothetical protein [Caudoviricetes sp.]